MGARCCSLLGSESAPVTGNSLVPSGPPSGASMPSTPDRLDVFLSCQLSAKCKEEMDAWLGKPPTTVKVSAPPYNTRDALKSPTFSSGQINYNVSTFGVKMPNAVMAFFEIDEVSKMGVSKSIPVPKYGLDTFVQKKVPKAMDLCEAAKEMNLDEKNASALEKYVKFCEEFQDFKVLDDVKKTREAWNTFITNNSPDGWEDNLAFDAVLVKNFGFDQEVSDKLRAMTRQEEDKGEMKTVTYEQHSLRWLTKIYKAYGPVGCQTDVINLVFAMMGKAQPKEADEAQALAVLENFKAKLVAKTVSDLWVPTHFIHDGESDDAMTWLLLEYLHSLLGTKLKVHIQMPADTSCEKVHAFLKSHPTKPSTFVDKDSGNAKNFVKPWEEFLNAAT